MVRHSRGTPLGGWGVRALFVVPGVGWQACSTLFSPWDPLSPRLREVTIVCGECWNLLKRRAAAVDFKSKHRGLPPLDEPTRA